MVMPLRVVIVENNAQNLNRLTELIREVAPDARIKGFVEGREALAWCKENSFLVDLFIGNWWGTREAYRSPEGAYVFHLVKWYRTPKKVLIADEPMFEKWSYQDGAIGFIQRPATREKVLEIFQKLRD